MLTGYPVEDLALRRSFVEASRTSITRLAARLLDAGLGDLVAVVGYLDRTNEPDHPKARRRPTKRRRCPAPGSGGRAPTRSITCPTTGCSTSSAISCPATNSRARVSAESTLRWPSARTSGRTAGRGRALPRLARALLAVINGPPVRAGQGRRTRRPAATPGPGGGRPLAYVNLVGGQDELVFDGDTMIARAGRRRSCERTMQFVEELLVADLDLAPGDWPLLRCRANWPKVRFRPSPARAA